MKEDRLHKYSCAFEAAMAYELNCRAKYDYPDNRPSKPPIKGERMDDFAMKFNTTVKEMKQCEKHVDDAIGRIEFLKENPKRYAEFMNYYFPDLDKAKPYVPIGRNPNPFK